MATPLASRFSINKSRDEWSTAMVSLAEVFHPWVRWEGPGSELQSLSVVVAVDVVGGLEIWDFAPFGLRSKNKICERLGTEQVKSFKELG